MTAPIWITEKLVHTVHDLLLAEHGGLTGLRDQGLLKSALAKPQQLYSYKPDSTLFELATAYSFGLAKNHPFIDGNKRIAFTISAVFLELNGKELTAPEAEVVVFYEGLAAGKITEEELTRFLRVNCK